MPDNGVALVVGAGPGLGAAITRRFAAGGFAVAVSTRTASAVEELASALAASGATARAYPVDATDEPAVVSMVDAVERDLGPIAIAVYNAGGFQRSSVLETTAEEFERCWRVGCLGGFLLGREVARRMVPRGRGTIMMTGATAALRGSARFVTLAVGKFGLRALAQSMARELGPEGIHVAHVIVDGQIDAERFAAEREKRPPDALLSDDAIAETYWNIHHQHRSAWTLEVDVRPWVERF
jgi:NAD(P)-dependent dehydrogenase (short-subunit alcohol dehydrogenase family)